LKLASIWLAHINLWPQKGDSLATLLLPAGPNLLPFDMPVPTSLTSARQNNLEIALYIDGNTQSMGSVWASLEGASATLGTSGIDHAALAERIGNSDDNKR
jgi:hypothetical protein